jgi:hypothetical protein
MRASIDTLLAVVTHGSRDAQRYAVMAISNLAATDRTREMLKERGTEAILRQCAQANSGDAMLTSVRYDAPTYIHTHVHMHAARRRNTNSCARSLTHTLSLSRTVLGAMFALLTLSLSRARAHTHSLSLSSLLLFRSLALLLPLSMQLVNRTALINLKRNGTQVFNIPPPAGL